MIVNLNADAEDPETLREQINASFSELANAINESLIGEVIRYAGPGTYAHSLGVKPLFGMVCTDTEAAATGFGFLTLDEGGTDWSDSAVYINLDITGVNPPDVGFMEILLVARP